MTAITSRDLARELGRLAEPPREGDTHVEWEYRTVTASYFFEDGATALQKVLEGGWRIAAVTEENDYLSAEGVRMALWRPTGPPRPRTFLNRRASSRRRAAPRWQRR